MDYELSLKVEFSKELSEKEQSAFWNFLVEEIEKIGVYAVGGHDSYSLDWVLDYSKSSLKKYEIIAKIEDSLVSYDEKILDLTIE